MSDQTEILEFLGASGTHGGVDVERIDTHSAVVFLAGDRAWKVKRDVKFDYLDFSTLELRRRACEAELAINRRTAPTLYLRVVPVTREPGGHLALDGQGVPVEWMILMRRFDQEALLDRLAARGALELGVCATLAEEVACFHRDAPRRDEMGGAAAMAWVIDGNVEGLAEQGAGVLDADMCAALARESRAALSRHAARLDERCRSGAVRQCHGDLHLRNIVLLDGRPTLFDAVEFNDRISCGDVLYDLAFLLMDLWRRRLPRHANVVLNGYLHEIGDWTGLALLPLFLSCRAAVRAKTSATAGRLAADAGARRDYEDASRAYLTASLDLLRPAAASLVAVGGLSGTGKSTQALGLAPQVGPVPGAVVLRSDQVRKQMFGVPASARLGAEHYTAEASARVYARLLELAGRILGAGHGVVVDAVFAKPHERDAIEAVAAAAGVMFSGVWLETSDDVRVERVGARLADVSDADAAVARRQAAVETGQIGWTPVDATPSPDRVLARVREAVRGSGVVVGQLA